jgi:hypothetical protein
MPDFTRIPPPKWQRPGEVLGATVTTCRARPVARHHTPARHIDRGASRGVSHWHAWGRGKQHGEGGRTGASHSDPQPAATAEAPASSVGQAAAPSLEAAGGGPPSRQPRERCTHLQTTPAEDLPRHPRASDAAARLCLVHQLRLTSTSTVGSCVRRPTGEVGSVVVGRDGGSCPRPGVVRGQLAGRRTSTEPRLKPSAGQPPRRMQVGPPATICVLQCESLGRLNALCWTRRGRLPGA